MLDRIRRILLLSSTPTRVLYGSRARAIGASAVDLEEARMSLSEADDWIVHDVRVGDASRMAYEWKIESPIGADLSRSVFSPDGHAPSTIGACPANVEICVEATYVGATSEGATLHVTIVGMERPVMDGSQIEWTTPRGSA